MQKIGRQRLLKAIVIALLALGVQTAAHAAEGGDALAIHGYGHQGYLQSNDNLYLGADAHGTWDYTLMDLVFTAKVDDRTRIWAQVMNTAAKSSLDWAFVDYQFTPNFSGRAGQIKFPFGLYNEIIDARFLQLSTLPPILYQDSGMRYESFRGIAANYNHDVGAGSLSWDIYAGQALDQEQVGISKFGRLSGGRVTYKTPVDGLRFIASVFGSNEEEIASGAKTRQQTSALSIDYTANNWDIKSESAKNKEFGTDSNTWYVQAGYTLGEKWTPYMRYDYITTDKTQKTDPSYYQKTTTVGLDYKINSNVSVRLEDHLNRGYAMPVKTYDAAAGTGVAASTGKENWNMLAASVNFIF